MTTMKSRYREIAEQLIDDIRSGTWKLGGKLPTEGDLVDRFGASRATIRESLRELESSGYIKRRRGTRSVLITNDPKQGFVNSVQSIGELLQYSRYTDSQVLTADSVIAEASLAERLNVPEGSRWLRIEIMRHAVDGSSLPIGYSEIYVDNQYADISSGLEDGKDVHSLLEDKYNLGFRSVRQTLFASKASANVASRLSIPVDSVILMTRTEFITNDDVTAEIGFGHFPADRYRVEIVLERDLGSQQETL